MNELIIKQHNVKKIKIFHYFTTKNTDEIITKNNTTKIMI